MQTLPHLPMNDHWLSTVKIFMYVVIVVARKSTVMIDVKTNMLFPIKLCSKQERRKLFSLEREECLKLADSKSFHAQHVRIASNCQSVLKNGIKAGARCSWQQ